VFGFDTFRPVGGIIDDMIEELDVCALKVAEIDNEFWINVEGVQEYDSDLAKKAVENPDKYASKTWRDNPIETAR
jgi:FMN-dependent NADH-azoreductase